MRFKYFAAFAAILLAGIALHACGGGGSGDLSAAQISKCVPVPAGDVKWTYESCGPHTNGTPVDIVESTKGYVRSGSGYKEGAINSQYPLSKGSLTFTITNLNWTDYRFPPPTDVVFLLFMAQAPSATNAAAYREANWHILGWRDSINGAIWMKLVAQRFDGKCLPDYTRSCERKSDALDTPVFERSRTYRFDCAWDVNGDSGWYGSGARDGYVECALYDVTSPSSPQWIITHTVPAGGPFDKLSYLCIGGGCGPLRAGKPTLPTNLTNLRVTLFK